MSHASRQYSKHYEEGGQHTPPHRPPKPKRGFLDSVKGFFRSLIWMASEQDSRIAQHRLPRTIWMLGVRYDLGVRAADDCGEEASESGDTALLEFRRDMQSRLWFTYRCNMAPIAQNLTSDTGWGCMLRSGQMMFAQALLIHNLGRSWRLPLDLAYNKMPEGYRQVLEFFEDTPSAPFSVHAIARAGERVGKRAGTWLGPNTVCSAFASLYEAKKCPELCGMQLLLLDRGDGDNTIYLDEARTRLENGPALILLPVRLGMHKIDASYVAKVEHIFSFPQSVGFIGGRPASAHYFVASQGPAVFFLDPHTQRDRVVLDANASAPLHLSWHTNTCRRMPLADIDASLTFGFYVNDEADLLQLADSISKSNASMQGYPAISVAAHRAVVPHEQGMQGAGPEGAVGGSIEEEQEDDDGFSLI